MAAKIEQAIKYAMLSASGLYLAEEGSEELFTNELEKARLFETNEQIHKYAYENGIAVDGAFSCKVEVSNIMVGEVAQLRYLAEERNSNKPQLKSV